MIYTLTLNPAVDHTIYVKDINERDVTRVRKTMKDAAGKGINVSKVLRTINQDSICLGFIAGDNGKYIMDELQRRNIGMDFVKVNGETRENVKIFVESEGKVLQLNEEGPIIFGSHKKELLVKLDTLLKEGDILVISGSVPKGVENTMYKDIVRRYSDVFTVLDVSGDLLTHALESLPNVVKPNLYELEEYMGAPLNDNKSIIVASKQLIEKGVEHVVVTLDENGAIYVSKDKMFKINVPSVDAKNVVGAGDSFVAGFVYGIAHGFEMDKTLQYAAAVSCASVLTERTAKVDPIDINRLFYSVKVKEL